MSSSSTGIARVHPAGLCRRDLAEAEEENEGGAGPEEEEEGGGGRECRRQMSAHASRRRSVECKREVRSASSSAILALRVEVEEELLLRRVQIGQLRLI
jgi:hypothetical protein